MPSLMSRAVGSAARARTLAGAVLAGWAGLAVPAARAEVPSSGVAQIQAAYAELDGLAKTSRAAGTLPLWSDPKARPVLERLLDARAILGSPPYTAADVQPLDAVGEKAIAVYKTYLLFSPEADKLPDTAHNTFVYQDEVSRAGALLLRMAAAELGALADFAGKLPPEQMTDVRRAGMRQMHLGITQMITGTATMLRSPNLRPENRDVLVAALADEADGIAAGLTPADRTALIGQIEAALPSLSPAERAKLGRFTAALARTDCDGLCRIQ